VFKDDPTVDVWNLKRVCVPPQLANVEPGFDQANGILAATLHHQASISKLPGSAVGRLDDGRELHQLDFACRRLVREHDRPYAC
jgi:hypothetical protein